MFQNYRLFAIVEGLGDHEAIPALMRQYYNENNLWNFSTPTAVRSNGVNRLKAPFNSTKKLGIEHYVSSAMQGNPDGILVVLDGDKECPQRSERNDEGLGEELLRRAKTVSGNIPISVVIADPEVEVWFLAAYQHYLKLGLMQENEKLNESFFAYPRTGCKSTLAECLGRSYHETTDQVRFASQFTFKREDWFICKSLEKLTRELKYLCTTVSK